MEPRLSRRPIGRQRWRGQRSCPENSWTGPKGQVRLTTGAEALPTIDSYPGQASKDLTRASRQPPNWAGQSKSGSWKPTSRSFTAGGWCRVPLDQPSLLSCQVRSSGSDFSPDTGWRQELLLTTWWSRWEDVRDWLIDPILCLCSTIPCTCIDLLYHLDYYHLFIIVSLFIVASLTNHYCNFVTVPIGCSEHMDKWIANQLPQ